MPTMLTLTVFGLSLFGGDGVGRDFLSTLRDGERLGYATCMTGSDWATLTWTICPDPALCSEVGTSSHGWTLLFCREPAVTS